MLSVTQHEKWPKQQSTVEGEPETSSIRSCLLRKSRLTNVRVTSTGKIGRL